MKKSLLFSLFWFIFLFATAQYTFVKKWDKRYGGTEGEGFYSIHNTKDGGFILNGFSYSGVSGDKTQATRGQSDFWVVKLDSVGTKEWDKRYGGAGHEGFNIIIESACGGYLVGGNSGSSISGDQTQTAWGGGDYWLVKIDSLGNKEWDKRFGGALADYLLDLLETQDGGYLLGGLSNSGISGDKTQNNWDGNDDFWVVKIDSIGNKIWDKRFGGVGEDGLNSLVESSDESYILGGYSDCDSTGDKTQANHGNGDFWIVKIDTAGNKLWDKAYGGSSGDFLNSMIKTNDNCYLLAGYSYSGMSGDKTQANYGGIGDYWIVKIDSVGNKLWDKDFGGTGDDELYKIIQTNDNGYLLSGRSTSNNSGDKTENNLAQFQTWIVKTDSTGNKQWDKTIFTSSNCGGGYAVQTKDGCYLAGNETASGISGYKTQPAWNGSADYWILKFCMDTFAAINELTGQRQITVYPNPFTNDLSIALKRENIHEASFTVTNAIGQTIYRREETNLATGYTKMLDLSYLPNGVYFVEVITGGEKIVQQIVKG